MVRARRRGGVALFRSQRVHRALSCWRAGSEPALFILEKGVAALTQKYRPRENGASRTATAGHADDDYGPVEMRVASAGVYAPEANNTSARSSLGMRVKAGFCHGINERPALGADWTRMPRRRSVGSRVLADWT